jgi:carbamoyl-phosphate synthase large subunit
MKIVINKQELEEHVVNLLKTIQEINCFDHYLDGALKRKPMRSIYGKCIS